MSTTVDSTAVQQLQEQAREALGFVPNLVQELSQHNPAAARLYLNTTTLIEQGELGDLEREVVLLTVSRYNDCHYCSSLHGKQAVSVGLDRETMQTINSGGLPSDDDLRPLVQVTRLLLDKRGWLDDDDLESLKRDGITRAQLYEINALIGIKTFTNYVNHVAQTEVDPQLEL